MKASPLHRLNLALALFLSLFSPALTATDAPARFPPGRNEPLVIVRGVFPGKNGDRTPATIRNLIDVITDRYRDANITLVGVENIVVENLTLQWRRAKLEDPEPPLLGVLVALSQASGRKFIVQHFSQNDFVLAPDGPPGSSRAITEVFTLGTLMGVKRDGESPLRLAQAELAVLQKRYGDKHPRVMDASERIDILKAQYPPGPGGGPHVAKAIIQMIEEVVVTTQRAKAYGDVPEFKYHPAANLLVVVGSEEAIDLTRKVIAALEKNP